jgi:hypothetical protein
MGNQLAAPARVQPGELLASDVPSLVYKDSLGGACLSFFLSFLHTQERLILLLSPSNLGTAPART